MQWISYLCRPTDRATCLILRLKKSRLDHRYTVQCSTVQYCTVPKCTYSSQKRIVSPERWGGRRQRAKYPYIRYCVMFMFVKSFQA